jgi:sporulation protein YtfJ
MIDVNTIIGKPITTDDGITLIPISKVSFGFASGGADMPSAKKNTERGEETFGGGSGAGVKITPVAFLVVKDSQVRILNVLPPASTTVDRLIESAPEVLDKVSDLFTKKEK